MPRRLPLLQPTAHRIVLFGDLMAPPGANPPQVEDGLRDLLSTADLVIGNLEAPIGDGRTWGNRFRISLRTLETTLGRLGIEPDRCCLSIANNHMGDAGAEGVDRTVDALRRMGISSIGWMDSDGRVSSRRNVNGLSVELVAWTRWLNRAMGSQDRQVIQQSSILGWLNAPRREPADLTVAFPHWGYEFVHAAHSDERRTAGALADHGVDLIAGHHPHVIQPAERIGRALCFYSLGGLVQGRAAALRWPARLGALLIVDVGSKKASSPLALGYELVPVVHDHRAAEHRVTRLDHADVRDRGRMNRRLNAVFPETLPG